MAQDESSLGGGSSTGGGGGPKVQKMKKVISKLLEDNGYNPAITLGQIRGKIERKLGPKCPGFDFSSVAFKVQSRTLIQEVIHAHEDAVHGNGAAGSGGGTANGGNGEKKKKRAHSDRDDGRSASAAPADKKSKVGVVEEGGGAVAGPRTACHRPRTKRTPGWNGSRNWPRR